MASTVVSAQDAFVDLLTDLTTFAGVHVAFGGTAKLPKLRENVWVLPARNYRKDPAEQSRTETYDLIAQFEVFRIGETSGHEADERCWELIDAADAELTRKDFHGYGSRAGELAVIDRALGFQDDGWVSVMLVSFGVETWQ